MEPHPIRMTVTDDLERSRLTVAFRLLLAIPHAVWLALWSVAVVIVGVVNWFATLLAGRSPRRIHDFLAAYVRYATHVYAYVLLAANPFPGFGGEPGYPVEVEIDPPQPQRRWVSALRLLLAVPALLLVSVFFGYWGESGGSFGEENEGSRGSVGFSSRLGLALAVAFLGWFACLVRRRMPGGFRDLQTYLLRYGAQALGYLLLLTDRYPNSDPEEPHGGLPLPLHPIQVEVTDDLRRSRLSVFFRVLLTIPHLVWLALWAVATLLALLVSWVVTLATGRSPAAFHRFLAAYLRYETHVFAFLFLVANPFPGFTGRQGSYPVDLEIAPPERQGRWVTGFRLLLAIPAFIVSSTLGTALFVAGFLGWFAALATGRMPRGLRNLGAFALRYSAQVYAYGFLLTDRYPYSGPPERAAGVEEPAPAPLAA